MQALSTPILLDIWERGIGLSLTERALTLLAAACPDTPLDRLATLPIGARDSRLLELRELTFGSNLAAVVRCRGCHARLELDFTAADTRSSSERQPSDEHTDSDTFTVTVGDGEVHYRLPNSHDLTAAAGERSVDRARTLLLQRCVLSVDYMGATVPVTSAPPHVLEAVVDHMARVDPQGDVQVSFTCPSCGDPREIVFDIAYFFWHEIDAWAARTLRDVHALACAYGWREVDILAMSERRRQLYLELAG